MLAKVVRVSIAAIVVAAGWLGNPSESHAQANMWHTYSFVNRPAYISPTYATSWTAYRPYQWQTWQPWSGWWGSRPVVNWTVARPVYSTAVVGACGTVPLAAGTVQQPAVSYVPQTTYRPWFYGARYGAYRPVYPYGRTGVTSYYPPPTSWYAPQAAPAMVPSTTFTPAPALGSPQNTFNTPQPALKEVPPTDTDAPQLGPDVVEPLQNNTKSTRGPLRLLPQATNPRDRTAMQNRATTIQTAAHTNPGADRAVEVLRWRPAQR